jgi:hypothetical protein
VKQANEALPELGVDADVRAALGGGQFRFEEPVGWSR